MVCACGRVCVCVRVPQNHHRHHYCTAEPFVLAVVLFFIFAFLFDLLKSMWFCRFFFFVWCNNLFGGIVNLSKIVRIRKRKVEMKKAHFYFYMYNISDVISAKRNMCTHEWDWICQKFKHIGRTRTPIVHTHSRAHSARTLLFQISYYFFLLVNVGCASGEKFICLPQMCVRII